MLEQSGKPLIIYIEDDIEDVELLKDVFDHIEFKCELIHFWDGVSALEFLEQSKNTRQLPDLILLDINLSKLDGKETFVCLKADKSLTRIPVVILSTSNLDTDVDYFKKYQVPYLIKPGDINRFKEEVSFVLKQYFEIKSQSGDAAIKSTNRRASE
jgi:two-component system, chemotaxis family, response regulator Rcp1